MNLKSRTLLLSGLSTCCLFLLPTVVIADSFIPPTGKISPFRRDRLPLNDKTMSWLARVLTNVTSGSPYETAEHRRAVAKSLALAIALDPENRFVSDQLFTLIEGEKPDIVDKEKLERDKRQVWSMLGWLSSPEAGADGNLLAALIGETIAAIYPRDSQASSYTGKPEHQAWNGWVAELASFKKAPVMDQPPVIDKEKPDDEKEELTNNEPKKEQKYDPKGGIVLDNAKISTVLQMYDNEKALWLPKVVQVEMKGSNHPKTEEGEDYHGFRVEISGSPDDYWQIQEELSSPLRDRLSVHLGQLPDRGEIKIRVDSDDPYPFRKNRTAISGAAFVLANAALKGVTPNGTVIGEIDRSGKLKAPDFFWRTLMELAEGSGGRLIIPASVEPVFINMLALENPEFFFKYEVLMASSLDEFNLLASKEISGQHEEIYNKFKLIKDKAAGNALGPYLTNKFVRERLQEIVDQAPYHLSAKILNIYGTPERPRYLTREALGSEIWRTVDVVNEITKIEDIYGINANQLTKLDELYKKMRDDLRDLERYTDSRNMDLLKEAKDLVTAVRGFGREFEGKGERWEKYDDIQEAKNDMRRANSGLLKKLTELTGDPLPQ
jgi:hypothetical protein